MTRKLIYLLCLLCPVLSGCTDESVLPGTVAALPGEEVSVKLVVSTDPYNTPSPGETRACEDSILSTVSTPDMDIELVKTPVTRAGTGDVNAEYDIYTFTLLQFDGTTRNAVLSHKATIPCPDGRIDTRTVQLFTTQNSSGVVVKNRFVVIANLAEGDFTKAMIEGTYTYGQLEDVFIKKADNPEFPLNQVKVGMETKNLMLMFGITDASIDKVEGKQIGIALKRSVAKVTFNIKQDPLFGKTFDSWDVTLLNLPNKSYLDTQGQKAIFPTEGQMSGEGGYYSKQLTTLPQGDQLPINGKSAYIPVNLQHDVPTATHFSRRDNAPPHGTYVQIMGKKITTSGALSDYVIYQIFLGKNLSTDYSIYANYSLTYNITLKGQHEDDSNVVRLIPGYFSGGLEAFDINGIKLNPITPGTEIFPSTAVKWKYFRKIEGYFMDSSYPKGGAEISGTTNLRWWYVKGGTFNNLENNSLVDGITNTGDLQNDEKSYANYPAAHASYAGTNGLNVVAKPPYNDNISWYLPSIGELIGTWIATSSTASTLSGSYWSSTVTSGNKAYVISNQGAVYTDFAADGNTRHYVRSLRDPSKANNNIANNIANKQ